MSNTPLVIDQQTMKEHFIAIRYVHGSGGHFLNAWLTASKLNLPGIPLGDYGSGHHAHKEFNFFKNPKVLPEPIYDITTPAPYFIHTEYPVLPAIASIFYKVINISYDLDDCNELELCFLGKFFLEMNRKKIRYARQHKYKHKHYLPIESVDNILNISWKEYLYGDADTLCKKLKIFTGLENIKIVPLLEWREQTKMCMNKTNGQIKILEDLIEL